MIIKNKTTCNNNMINQATVVSNSKIETYRKKKLIYNCIGLLSGMTAAGIMARQLASTGDYNIFIIIPFVAVCGFCLFMGMYYLDRNKYNQIKQYYSGMGCTSIQYEIDSEEIIVNAGSKQSAYRWDDAVSWMENQNYFYIIYDTGSEPEAFILGECLIISKKGFTQCTASDLRQLCGAVMEEHKNKRNNNS